MKLRLVECIYDACMHACIYVRTGRSAFRPVEAGSTIRSAATTAVVSRPVPPSSRLPSSATIKRQWKDVYGKVIKDKYRKKLEIVLSENRKEVVQRRR